MENIMKTFIIAAVLLALAGAAPAQYMAQTTIVSPDALDWKDAPSLPKGAQYVILSGDAAKPGSSPLTPEEQEWEKAVYNP